VLPAWDGSKTALAGSKIRLCPEKIWRFRPYTAAFLFRNWHWSPAGTTKSFPTALAQAVCRS
jgi:hypothetical protein